MRRLEQWRRSPRAEPPVEAAHGVRPAPPVARRRRRVLAVVALAATAFVVILAAPLFRKAVTEFTLPLTTRT